VDWQDRLRELDARLVRGELTRREYQVQRDELLAEASSSSALRHQQAARTPSGSFPALVAPPPHQPPTFAPGAPEVPVPLAGAEVFTAAAARSRGPRAALIGVAVLALVAGVLWVVLLKPFSGNDAAPPAAPASLAEQVPTPPGRPNPKNGVLAVPAAVEAGVITRGGAETLGGSGVLEVVFRSTVDGDLGTAVVAGRANSADAARTGVEELHAGVLGRGFREFDTAAAGGRAAIKENADNRYVNSVFPVGDVIVQISLSQPVDADVQQLTTALDGLTAQLSSAIGGT
jgi:hypothetical protein